MKGFTSKAGFFLAAIIFLAGSFTAKAQIVYDGTKDILSVGSAVSYYIDSAETETIGSIQKRKDFIVSKENVPDFGLLKVPVWMKVQVTNKSDVTGLMLQFEQSFLQNIDFYYPQNGGYKVNRSGEVTGFHSRMVNYHKFVYDFNIPKDSTATYYFRVKSILKMRMPLSLGKKESIVESNFGKNIAFGLFFGIILVMFFYNLFIYISLRDPIYLVYVAYIIIVGLTQTTFEGYTFQYLWPNNGFVAIRSFFVLTALVNIAGIEFVRKFLNTKEFVPQLDKLAWFIYLVYIVDIVFIVKGEFFTGYQIIQAFGGPVSIYILTMSIKIANRGYRPAKFFIIAWIPLIAGIIIWFLGDFNVLPYNTFTNYSMTIGASIEVILLSFALADKINIFKAEKEKSQEETVKALQENERIIREQNIILESKVTERTHELNETNRELSNTLDDLKQTQSQLVESEKMASLGQLTAGIAHEINNPINFVTSNVTPLRRDVDMLLDAINAIEEVGLSDAPAEEKKKKIEEYKEELDFDYLKTEISHLLKGIHEGASRTAGIVKGLRVFSRLDEDDLKKADVNEGIESTLVIINNLLNNRIKIVTAFGNLPLIECYPGKLNQVFLNILSNAVHAINKKFGEEVGGEIRITTEATEHSVLIRIADNGSGMEENTKKKIYEPFFTTKEVGEGTGLGMSITYNTIKKHNGKISLESTLGEGTEFLLELPVIHQLQLA